MSTSFTERKEPAIFRLAIHGGLSDSGRWDPDFHAADAQIILSTAVSLGSELLRKNTSAVDVVEAVTAYLEDAEVFNAGKGAAYNIEGKHELEAAIVDGFTGKAGSVACLRTTRNPVHAARLLLDIGPHPFMTGDAADIFAASKGAVQVDNSFFDTERRRKHFESGIAGAAPSTLLETVGAVALDTMGRLAAAGSTGGIIGKRVGRIGDTCILGAGIFADASSAIVCSGAGDAILSNVVAAKVASLVTFEPLANSATRILRSLPDALSAPCAIIGISADGAICVQSTGRRFLIASANQENEAVSFIANTIPVLARHEAFREGRFVAGVSRYPTSPGQSIVTVEGTENLSSTLSVNDFVGLLSFTRRVALALEECIGAERIELAADGEAINLIPLHGVGKDWEAAVHVEEEFHATYPGYLNSKSGPKLSVSDLQAMRTKIVAVSGLGDTYDKTFHGDQDDQNLFARIVRGELEQWRIWEDENHVAFLTPFANTPGFTVLVPRCHLHSDVFRLDNDSYTLLAQAAHAVMGILRDALQVTKVAFFFQGFEINYAHAKLVPIHPHPLGSAAHSFSAENHFDCYPGYITTQPGPRAPDFGQLDALALQLGKILSAKDRIFPIASWMDPSKPWSEDANRWYQSMFVIQDTLHSATVLHFKGLGFRYALAPVTTDSISSPMGLGSDSLPVSIELLGHNTYLADSMQFTLEMLLRVEAGCPGVWYMAPSFRGEDPDATHLNQFYHIECELLGDMDNAISVAENYVLAMVKTLLKEHAPLIEAIAGKTTHLTTFITLYAQQGSALPRISVDDAINLPDMPGGGWEYIVPGEPRFGRRLTRGGERFLITHFGGAVWLTDMDHLSVPFYQAYSDESRSKARCADLLLGLGETLGLGQRHLLAEEVAHSLEQHNVPEANYAWYIGLRNRKVIQTSGWGLGMERLLCWVFQHHDIRDIPIISRLKGIAGFP